jgi:dTDP-4-amino-4,6-dideoxygalactose transaminase
MIVTDNAGLAAKCRHLTKQAKLPGQAYVQDEVGFNYRPTNITAAVGLAQLEQLDDFLAAMAETYRAALDTLDSFGIPAPQTGSVSSHWLFSLLDLTRQRDQRIKSMNDEGIGVRPVWLPAHEQKPHADFPRLGGETAEQIGRQVVSLPSSSKLSTTEVERVRDRIAGE